jgi:hypothetical protein
MAGQEAKAARPAADAAARRDAAEAGPPLLPPPFHHNYLSRHGGELANAYLLVKYAVRYKGSGETVGVRGYPLGGSSASELLEAEPMAVDEAALAPQPARPVRHAALPDWLVSSGARGVERVLKERLSDKLAQEIWYDPVTKATSAPGEDAAAFAARLQTSGAGSQAEKLRERLDKKRRDLATAEQDLSGRKTEKWAALGTAILSNIGLLGGRKRTISGAGTVLTKNRMENTAEARVETLRAEVAELEKDLAEQSGVDPSRFQPRVARPGRSEVDVLRYDLVWVY